MHYDFSKMDPDSFENMVRSLNQRMFGIPCEQYGRGADGQREFVFEGSITDSEGKLLAGRTIGQVKYKYGSTKLDDYSWLVKEIDKELKHFKEKEIEYIPDNYLFYTNVVLTPAKDTGIKDRINAYVKKNNSIIKHFYIRGYDEICAMLDNNRDVATSYAQFILSGDLLMKMLGNEKIEYSKLLKRYLMREFEEELYTRMEQAGSATEKKIAIEKVCIDINVLDRERRRKFRFAERVFALGNEALGYRKAENEGELKRDENYILIGGPGNGKSTICQFITQIYRAKYLQTLDAHSSSLEKFLTDINNGYGYQIEHKRIPFKILLREYAAWINRKGERNISVMQYMKDRIEKLSGDVVSIEMLRKMLEGQAWIFFFDGLDEVPESSNRQEVLRQLHVFISGELRDRQCDCMIIGTTRAQGYNNDFDDSKYKHVEVADLSRQDCHVYIQKLFEVMEEQTERRENYVRIMKQALDDEITSRLMKTPLQITIIAILVKSGGKPPHERYSLFRQYYDIMIRREKQKEVVATLNDNTEWLEEIHYIIGDRLQCESEREDNPSAEISQNELKKVIKIYVEGNYDSSYDCCDNVQITIDKKVEDFFSTITQRICFLCENREGFYSFSIRSIQEYFAGTYMVKGKGDEETLNNIRQVAYNSYWRNTMLFALGYIELERKCLEPQIGQMCEEMNGRDNIVKEDFGIENLCLFGSWLAIDILAEDIFRGKQQAKYVELASKVLSLTECEKFNGVRLISGAQKDKLVAFTRERYFDKGYMLEEILMLYLKMNENEKNQLDSRIQSVFIRLPEERQLKVAIYILENGIETSEEIRVMARQQIIKALELDKVKFFLPSSILKEIMRSVDENMELVLRKNLFVQIFFQDDRRIGNTGIQDIILSKLGTSLDLNKAKAYLLPVYFFRPESNALIPITEGFDVVIKKYTADKEELETVRSGLHELHLEFLEQFCVFLMDPSYQNYLKVCGDLKRQDNYLADKYSEMLKAYVGSKDLNEEQEYFVSRLMWRADYEKILNGNFEEVQYSEPKIEMMFSATCSQSVFDDLVERGTLRFDELERLGNRFFEAFVFAAKVQLESMGDVERIGAETAKRMIHLVCEASRRKIYSYQMYELIGVLLLSRFKKDLWEKLPDFPFTEQMLQTELLQTTKIPRSIEWMGAEELQNILRNIIGKVLYEEQENSYLTLIPLLIDERIDVRRCISDSDMKKLNEIEYSVGANMLAVKLLQMCLGQNENPGEIIEEMFSVNVPSKAIYMELANMFRYCEVENKEKLWVKVYLRLENEDFQGCKQIRNRMMNDMIEEKCNMVTR